MAATAAPATITESPVAAEAEWSEARIDSAMARLQDMHAQLRRLRDAVALLVDPMLVQQSSPEKLYNTFAQNVVSTRSNIRNFSSLVSSDGSKEMFQKAEESRTQSGEDIRGWRVTEHDDWLDVRNEDIPMDVNPDGADHSMTAQNVTNEEMRTAVDKFKKDHAGVDASVDGDSRIIMIHFPSPTGLRFEIAIQNTTPAYTIQCKEKPNVQMAIARHLNAVVESQSLDYVLVSAMLSL
ncbi:MAG: hypothetical protein Q9222_002418 [Ikaeria aurantiellina]